MQKYEEFLENVKRENPDEYSELSDILSRFKTLRDSNQSLQENQKYIQDKLDSLTNQVNTHTKDMDSKIMGINNDIAIKQKELEVSFQVTIQDIEEEKNRLQSETEENTSKKMDKTSETGQILMSIDNLYNKCFGRKEKAYIKHPMPNEDHPKNFDDMKERGSMAIQQLELLEMYLDDFKQLRERLANNEAINKKKNEMRLNNEII